jgi:hypothetical protein
MFLRRLWLLPLVALLGACATHENIRDTTQLPPGTGIMVAHVLVRSVNNMGYPPITLSLGRMDNSLAANAKSIALASSDNMIVLDLPAGDYSWTDVQIMDLEGYTRRRMPFTIEAGKINYVGDILLVLDGVHVTMVHGRKIPGYAIHVKDDHTYTLPNAASMYPQLWSSFPVVTHLTQDHRKSAN